MDWGRRFVPVTVAAAVEEEEEGKYAEMESSPMPTLALALPRA